MKTFIHMLIIPMSILLSLATGTLVAQEVEILTGTVKAVQWYDESEVIAAVLAVITDEEDEEGKLITYLDEYKILDDRIGKELFKLDGETVEVSGLFLEEDDGTIFLKVKSFQVIKPSEEDLNEEDPDEDEYDTEEPPQ